MSCDLGRLACRRLGGTCANWKVLNIAVFCCAVLSFIDTQLREAPRNDHGVVCRGPCLLRGRALAQVTAEPFKSQRAEKSIVTSGFAPVRFTSAAEILRSSSESTRNDKQAAANSFRVLGRLDSGGGSQLGRDDARTQPLDSPASLAARVQAQRDQLFKAMSIVECCKFATATLLAVDDSEYMIPAFEAICELIDTSAEELEKIASECASVAQAGRSRVRPSGS